MVNTNWKAYLSGFHSYLLLERALSVHTIKAYLSDLGKLVQYLELQDNKQPPVELSRQQLEQFVFWLHQLGLGARSQARLISSLKAFYKYLLIEDLITDDPTALLESPKLARKIPQVLTYEEIQAVLHSIDVSTPHGTRNRAMLETLYACGLRVSELVELKLSNLFLDIGFIKIVGKGNKERIVPIGEIAAKHIAIYVNNIRRVQRNIDPDHANVLFLNRRGRQLTRVMLFMVVKEAAKAAGVQKRVSPHTFRHSFATHLIEGGADLKAVQDMLGHESIITTEIYTHLDTEYLRSTIQNFHPRNKKYNKT
ncbi:MAG: site-specific tyrosine recombinase XerD [Bacteroidota bacterium]